MEVTDILLLGISDLPLTHPPKQTIVLVLLLFVQAIFGTDSTDHRLQFRLKYHGASKRVRQMEFDHPSVHSFPDASVNLPPFARFFAKPLFPNLFVGGRITTSFGPPTPHPKKFTKFSLVSVFLETIGERPETPKFSKSALPQQGITSFGKGVFSESSVSRDSRDFRDSRESPVCGKQRRIRPLSRDSGEFTVRVKIITGSLVTLENLFPENYRYRYRLEIRMNYHYRYCLGPRSRPFIFH